MIFQQNCLNYHGENETCLDMVIQVNPTLAYRAGFRRRDLSEIGVRNPSHSGCERRWCCEYLGFGCRRKCLRGT